MFDFEILNKSPTCTVSTRLIRLVTLVTDALVVSKRIFTISVDAEVSEHVAFIDIYKKIYIR